MVNKITFNVQGTERTHELKEGVEWEYGNKGVFFKLQVKDGELYFELEDNNLPPEPS